MEGMESDQRTTKTAVATAGALTSLFFEVFLVLILESVFARTGKNDVHTHTHINTHAYI
jgi:hypothetical protein